ncbi:DUF1249 domain-containing protein [Marinimicrobium sp. ABcell2]|uniref:DUF1249 domain-containing protein n=1 Tax=Marinimicrobium sp. ABcell2 TaxID=3069751 RepID=UPI0027AFEFE0|nr:DUF1249 domain-containing protein [Marinimicrobium sp. ABcell2]MDQ2076452.1 DUF1249 domain-containing protein [Marinimicrobium sp. ABcell2]
MSKPRYKVDLPRQQAECEANYWRLRKLMPGVTYTERWQFTVLAGDNLHHTRIQVLERSRYTTSVQITQVARGDSEGSWLKAPKLTVRLYHDARLAEVLTWEHHRRLQPRYDYPNRAMYQSDEKAQLNRFLGEWLSVCLQCGHSLEKVGR